MILISSRKVEQALADGSMELWDKVKYLILPAVLGSLTGPLYVIRPIYGTRAPTLNSLVSMLSGFLTAYLTYRGIKWCFEENQQIDGKAFFERFAVLTIPPLVRIMIVIVPLSLALGFAGVALREQIPFLFKRASLISALIGPIITYTLYSMVRNSFLRLGKLIKTEEPEGS